jgi:hypothetical protein
MHSTVLPSWTIEGINSRFDTQLRVITGQERDLSPLFTFQVLKVGGE